MHVAEIQILAAMKSDSRLHSHRVMETSCIDSSQQKLCSKESRQEGCLAGCSLQLALYHHLHLENPNGLVRNTDFAESKITVLQVSLFCRYST